MENKEKNSAFEKVEKIANEKPREDKKEKKATKKYKKMLLKAEKIESKRLKKYSNEKHEKKGQKSKSSKLLVAVITLGISTLILASVLTFVFIMPTTADTNLEANYQRAFYDAVEQVDNIDLNMSKLLASKEEGAKQKYLVDVIVNAELAENDLQSLPLKDESKFYTAKLVNQVGDYCKHLNNKILQGEHLQNEDLANLYRLQEQITTYKGSLQKILSKMGEDFNFSSINNEGKGNIVLESFEELQNLSVSYPELIYDGPFSDGLDRKELKGLPKSEISKEEAKTNFIKIFKNYSIKDVAVLGKTSGKIECYNIEAKSKEDTIFAQISVLGGKLIMFDMSGSCEEVNYERYFAEKKAKEFLESIGITSTEAVWANLSNNVYTINFAYTQNDIPIYSDLIKVRVCAQTGEVIGIEASSYYTNHTQRNIEPASISKEKAKSFVSSNMEIKTSRLVVVPIGNSSEKLCYEFSGEIEESVYYVYIDAKTGRQVEMFKVIESTEGQLLI